MQSNWEILSRLLDYYNSILQDVIQEMGDKAGNPTEMAFTAGKVAQVNEVINTLEYWATRTEEEF